MKHTAYLGLLNNVIYPQTGVLNLISFTWEVYRRCDDEYYIYTIV